MARLVEILVADEVAQLDHLHIVILRSSLTTQFVGPFPDAIAAACAAEVEIQTNEQLAEEDRLCITVAPLLSPSPS
ncbi:hypothetical protein GCM10023066_11970 [Nocardioides kongjuensis]